MIKKHDFNSQWWGSDTGIVFDSAFFSLPEEEQKAKLSPYNWVEFRSLISQSPELSRIHKAGFFQVDTQCRYRLALSKVESTPSVEELEAQSAKEKPFEITVDIIKGFENERFTALPGIGIEKSNERYVLWANKLIKDNPESCLLVTSNSAPQGWMLSQKKEQSLNMALGMLHKEATISGLLLYQKVTIEYARRGHKIAEASFSPNNYPSHNIHAKLGARFVEPELFWMWIKQ